eukprot:scaffold354743_cov48-Prasinocladus_malaysianus.AAC.1
MDPGKPGSPFDLKRASGSSGTYLIEGVSESLPKSAWGRHHFPLCMFSGSGSDILMEYKSGVVIHDGFLLFACQVCSQDHTRTHSEPASGVSEMTAIFEGPKHDLEEVCSHAIIEGVSCMAIASTGAVAVGTKAHVKTLNLWEHIEMTDELLIPGAISTTAMSFSHSGRVIAAGNAMGMLSLYDTKEKRELT